MVSGEWCAFVWTFEIVYVRANSVVCFNLIDLETWRMDLYLVIVTVRLCPGDMRYVTVQFA